MIEKQLTGDMDIQKEWENISQIVKETTNVVIGRVKGIKKPEWLSPETLQQVDERKDWKKKRSESKDSNKLSLQEGKEAG